MEIRRDGDLRSLIGRKHNGFVKVIAGVRRCGKSYLLNELFYRHLLSAGVPQSHIIRFSFAKADSLALIGQTVPESAVSPTPIPPQKFLEFIDAQTSEEGRYYLLLDDIERLGAFEHVLIGFLRNPDFDVYVTSGNAKGLTREAITEFAGRAEEIRLRPLSFAEFMQAAGTDRYEDLKSYLRWGGFPEAAAEKGTEAKTACLQNLLREILIPGLTARHKLKRGNSLSDLLTVLAGSEGQVTDARKLSDAMRALNKALVSPAVLRRYLACLEDAFIIGRAPRYSLKRKACLSFGAKYYFADPGLLNACLNFRQQDPDALIENLVYNEMRRRGFTVAAGVMPSTSSRAGRDAGEKPRTCLVCEKGDIRYYIRAVGSLPDPEKRRPETDFLHGIKDFFKKIIVSGDLIPTAYDERGILFMSIYDFLPDPEAIRH